MNIGTQGQCLYPTCLNTPAWNFVVILQSGVFNWCCSCSLQYSGPPGAGLDIAALETSRQVYWRWLELNSAGCWAFRSRFGHPYLTGVKFIKYDLLILNDLMLFRVVSASDVTPTDRWLNV